MANIIEITLKATDKTKGVLGKVGGALAGIGKAAIVGAAAGFAIAGTAAIGFGIKAVMAGADAEEMMSKLNATFGDASESMIDNLDAFAAATGRSRYELRTAATDMGAVIKALGGTETEAAAMSTTMTMLATDLGAFNNLPTADVAHKIQTALTGEFESLKSLGIVINQAKLNQELLNMGIEKGTAGATDYEKALAIQNIMMRQSADAQGTAAVEADSFTGRMVALKAAMSDFTTEVGMALLPVITPLIQKLAVLAQEVLPIVAAWIENKLVPALSKMAKWLSKNIPIAIQVLSDFWTNVLLPVLTEVQDFIKTTLIPIFKVIVAWLQVNVPIAVQYLSDLWNNTLYPAIQKIWAFISTYLVPIFLGIADVLSATVGLAVQVLAGLWQNVLQPALSTVWRFIQNNIIPIFQRLARSLSPVKDMLRSVADWIKRVADKLRSIRLPSWLTGKSPSPFENTLHGISDALKEISGVRLPKFQAALDFGSPPMMAASSPGGGMGVGSASNMSMDNSRIVELLRSIDEKPPIDELKLARLIRDAVLQVTG